MAQRTPRLTREQKRLLALYTGATVRPVRGSPPRVAVVGAGLAGLTAATLLANAGCAPALFEASDRIGGRIWTEHGDGGEVWELGGEFIDSQHDDMHALAACYGVEMLDTLPDSEAALGTLYRFGGTNYSSEQVRAAFAEVAPRIAADAGSLSRRPSWRSAQKNDQRFDRMSIAEYLAGLRLDRWLHDLLEVAYVTVYGLDAGEQSALNLLTLIGTDTSTGAFEVFGTSDERFKIRNGTQCLTDAMAASLGDRLFLEWRLVRVRRAANTWMLTFEGPSKTIEVPADAVVLTLPFSLLRHVDMGDLLPPVQRHAVDELGYGTNSKLLLATHAPFWREHGCDGGVYTDTPLQTSWDCSRLRGESTGVFTVFLGGNEGDRLGQGDCDTHVRRFTALADEVFPGFAAQRLVEATRVHWASQPFALGAYTCYRPGQWSVFGGAEATPLSGGLYFAGEHCATDSQGYMNGAAQTGREAAQAILTRLA